MVALGRRYRFGAFELEPRGLVLSRDGHPVPVEPKVFDFLAFLVEHRDRVVSKEELLAAVWPDVHVGEDVLTRCASLARRALDDTASRQQTIRTVYGRGYQFVAPVRQVDARVALQTPRALEGAPLVGREQVLAELSRAVISAGRGRGRLIFLLGEAGIGKTRTCEEIAARVRRDGGAVAFGRCREEDGAPAYSPWIEILRSIAEGLPPASAPSRVRRARSGLQELVGIPPGTLPHGPGGRFQLFQAVTAHLRDAADRSHSGSLLVALEDIHFADEPTLRLLQFLAAEIRETRLLLLATYREHAIDPRSVREACVAESLRRAAAVSIRLDPLSPHQVGQLVTAVLGRDSTPEQTSIAFDLSGGNPFLLSQIVPRLESVEVDDAGRIDARRLPRTVRGAVASQLDCLDSETLGLLRMAAVVGKDVRVGVLERVSGCRAPRIREKMTAAQRYGLVVPSGSRGHAVRFAHGLVRDVLYAELDAAERARIHARVGDAIAGLEGDGPDGPLAELSHHFDEACQLEEGLGPRSSRALDYAIRAAAAASERLGYEQAAHLYERARAILEARAPDRVEQRCDVVLALAESVARAGDGRRAAGLAREAANLATRAADPERGARAALALSPGLFEIGGTRYDPALIRLLETHARAAEPATRVRILARLGLALHATGGPPQDAERRAAVAAQAHSSMEACSDPASRAHARAARHAALSRPDQIHARRPLLDEIVALAARGRDPELELIHRVFRMSDHLEMGAIAEFEEDRQTFVQSARRLGQPEFEWFSVMLEATRFLMLGEFDRALEAGERYAVLGRNTGDVKVEQGRAVQQALAWAMGARWDRLEPLCRHVLDAASLPPIWLGLVMEARSLQGNRPEARRAFERVAAPGFGSLPLDRNWLPTLMLASDACALLDDRVRAEELVELLLPYADRFGVAGPVYLCLGSVSRSLGRLCTTLGRWDEAERWLERAEAGNRRLSLNGWLAITRLDRARLWRARGRATEADRIDRILDDARVQAEAMGAPLLAELAGTL